MTAAGTDRRPEWLIRKHGKQRSEPYLDLLTKGARCTAGHDGHHDRGVIITTVFDLDGNELPIGSEDEARNVSSALYRSRPRGGGVPAWRRAAVVAGCEPGFALLGEALLPLREL